MLPTNSTTDGANNTSSVQGVITRTVNAIPEFQQDRDNWDLWKERFEIYLEEIDCDGEKQKVSALLKAIGAEPYAVIHSLCSPKTPRDVPYVELCEYLKGQYTPPTIIFRERKNFYSAEKLDGETVSAWFARVKKLALHCKFGGELDSYVLDKFVCGMKGKFFERLCEEDETIKLSDALKKAIIFEAKIAAQSRITGTEVNFVKRNKESNNNQHNASSSQKSFTSRNNKKTCSHCGWKNHKSNACKFRTAQCHLCSEIGHLASICKKKKKGETVNFVESGDESAIKSNVSNFVDFASDFYDSFAIYSISSENFSDFRDYYLLVEINGIKMKIACDTGAPYSLFRVVHLINFIQMYL